MSHHKTYLLPLLSFALGICLSAEEHPPVRVATVKSESLPVHSQMSSGSRVIKSLKRGDKVTVDFDISTGPEEWCSVVEAGQTKPLGFVQCKNLDRPPTRRSATRPILTEDATDKTEGSGQKQQNTLKAPAGDYQKLMHGYNPEFWQSRLNFSDSQREQVGELAVKSGMVCVRDLAALYRRSGVWDFMSLAFALGSSQFATSLDSYFSACLPKFVQFWTDFPSLMTPEQRERFERERQSQGKFSDPATGLMLYALYHANRP